VLTRIPIIAEAVLRDRSWVTLDLRRHRVVPSIEEAEQPNHGEYLHDLTVIPVEAERPEMLRRHFVRTREASRAKRKATRSPSSYRSDRSKFQIWAIFSSGTPRSWASTAS